MKLVFRVLSRSYAPMSSRFLKLHSHGFAFSRSVSTCLNMWVLSMKYETRGEAWRTRSPGEHVLKPGELLSDSGHKNISQCSTLGTVYMRCTCSICSRLWFKSSVWSFVLRGTSVDILYKLVFIRNMWNAWNINHESWSNTCLRNSDAFGRHARRSVGQCSHNATRIKFHTSKLVPSRSNDDVTKTMMVSCLWGLVERCCKFGVDQIRRPFKRNSRGVGGVPC